MKRTSEPEAALAEVIMRSQSRPEDLNRHVPPVVRKTHSGHAAIAEFALEGVPAGQGSCPGRLSYNPNQ